ncbi:MAG: ATP-dependent metallopeptidase FtsH/Yme1/Tma family protein, partial [Bacilli bacterium]|nr:ATP-dependent metallopeptidase FtsH/Yme1/Tma family protein [Bacilli bacterium]
MTKKELKKNILPYIFLALIIFSIVYFVDRVNNKINILEYNQFYEYLTDGKVTEIQITPRNGAGVYEIIGKIDSYNDKETFFLRIPLTNESIAVIYEQHEINQFKIQTIKDPESNGIIIFLINVVPIILLIAFAFLIINKQMGAGNKSMDFGRSKAKLNDNNRKVTFNDVAGLTEEKEEVAELIDFLKMPKKFQRLGARIPKG